jgi:hypothetical protein
MLVERPNRRIRWWRSLVRVGRQGDPIDECLGLAENSAIETHHLFSELFDESFELGVGKGPVDAWRSRIISGSTRLEDDCRR